MKSKALIRKLVVIVFALTVLAGLVSCGKAKNKEVGVYKDGKLVVRFGSPNNGGKLLFELLEVALEQGILDEELAAIDAVGDYFPIDAAGPGINEAFAAGDIDVAVYGDFPATSAKTNGINTTIIGVANAIQSQAVFVRNNSGIENVKDLEGKTVAVGLGTNYQFFWENFVNGEKLDLNKISVVNSFDYSTLLATGDVDAASVGLVQALYFESLGLGHTLVDSNAQPEWTTQFLVAAYTPFIEAHPEVGVAVNKALIRAYDIIHQDPTTLYKAGSSDNIPYELVAAVNRITNMAGYDPSFITGDTATKLQAVIDLMYADGLIPKSIKASEWIDTQYYEKAKKELK